jgi:hypothetical protein
MTVYAMGLAVVNSTYAVASVLILSWRYWLQVLWITTHRDSAKMIEMKTFLYRLAGGQFVHEPVSQVDGVLILKSAVSACLGCSSPKPAWTEVWARRRHWAVWVNMA